MLSSILAWIFYLLYPLGNLSLRPIQPQERLKPEYQGLDSPWDIITGVYGVPPLLKIHDREGIVKWSWERNDVWNQRLPYQIRRCLFSSANDATDMKWIRNGTSIAAIYSNIVMIVNHTPHDPSIDKQITWAVCRDNEFLWNAHTLELLPGDRIAVGNTGQRSWDGILVYNASMDNPLVDDPPILQNITGLRAIHGMIWDESEQMLWAAGTDAAADGSDNIPAYGTIQGYPYDATTGLLQRDDSLQFKLSQALDQETEWGAEYGWWIGPHDLVPVPNERVFLISEDRDLHAFNLTSRQFTEEGEAVVEKYLQGFEKTSDDRNGYNKGQWEELPRSDLKGFSLGPEGSFIYVQSLWRKYRGDHTNLVVNGVKKDINEGDEIYRSRWFSDIAARYVQSSELASTAIILLQRPNKPEPPTGINEAYVIVGGKKRNGTLTFGRRWIELGDARKRATMTPTGNMYRSVVCPAVLNQVAKTFDVHQTPMFSVRSKYQGSDSMTGSAGAPWSLPPHSTTLSSSPLSLTTILVICGHRV